LYFGNILAKVRLFQEDRSNAEVLKAKFKESMAEEAAKEEARRAKVKKLQQFHVRQIEEKQQRMSLLQDETDGEIRDMERQFAVQVRSAARAAGCCGVTLGLGVSITPRPPVCLVLTRGAGCGVPGLRCEAGGAGASGGQEPSAHHTAAAEEHEAVAGGVR
jgi:hypothetical protein